MNKGCGAVEGREELVDLGSGPALTQTWARQLISLSLSYFIFKLQSIGMPGLNYYYENHIF